MMFARRFCISPGSALAGTSKTGSFPSTGIRLAHPLDSTSGQCRGTRAETVSVDDCFLSHLPRRFAMFTNSSTPPERPCSRASETRCAFCSFAWRRAGSLGCARGRECGRVRGHLEWRPVARCAPSNVGVTICLSPILPSTRTLCCLASSGPLPRTFSMPIPVLRGCSTLFVSCLPDRPSAEPGLAAYRFASSHTRDGTSRPTAPRRHEDGVGVSSAPGGGPCHHSSSVSAKEVEHFNKLSAEWWDVNGLFAALHDYNPRRVGFIRDNLQRLSIYQRILARPVRSPPPRKAEDGGQQGSERFRRLQPEDGARKVDPRSRDDMAHCTPVCDIPKGVDGQRRSLTSRASSDKEAEGVLSHVKILDIGCGGGILSEALAREGALVTGLDAAEAAIRVAESRRVTGPYAPLLRSRQQFVNASLEEFFAKQPGDGGGQKQRRAPEQNSFDVVICSEMLEHVEGGLAGVEAVIATAARAALATGGLFVATTLNRTPENYLFSIVAAEHLFGLIPKGTHEWAKFLKPEELREIAERHGLRLVGQQGVMYVPFLRTFISEPWCRLMYMMAFEKM